MLCALASLVSATSPAQAGIYTDDLSKCLVRSASDADQKALVLWVFMAMARHPSAQIYTNLTDKQRDDGDRAAAGIFQRLLFQDCRSETVSALKYEGANAIEPAFSVLGQVAMRGLMGEPSVAGGMSGMAKYVDVAKFDALAKEAGLPTTPTK